MHSLLRSSRQEITTHAKELRKSLEARKLALQSEAIEDYVMARAITTVYHFTPIQNLPSICAHGLLNRTSASKLRLRDPQIIFPDDHRWDGAEWAICCSIEWPNYKIMSKKQLDQDIPFAILALDASVIWELDCVFVPGNAARTDLRDRIPTLKLDRFNRLPQLQALFPEPDTRKLLWQSYPKDVQAEVLIAEAPVDLSYCQFIYFNSSRALRDVPDLPWPSHIRCEAYSEIFFARPDLRRR
jgi:hypothetical protein